MLKKILLWILNNSEACFLLQFHYYFFVKKHTTILIKLELTAIIKQHILLVFKLLQSSGGGVKREPSRAYVGFASLPNQVHRKSVKKGFEFTLMVAGTCLFIELYTCLLLLINFYDTYWMKFWCKNMKMKNY